MPSEQSGERKSGAAAGAAGHPHGHSPHSNQKLPLLVLGALGIVYGDIGTSPLYAMREAFSPAHGIATTHDNVLGILSLIFWALILVVVVKYLTFIMRADNRGEGGILALLALLHGRRRAVAPTLVLGLGLFGTALLFGEGIITPAISVLSAIEGIEVATPAFGRFIVPTTVAILIGLFMMQERGTARVGTIFGPITLVWFIAIATLGVMAIAREPRVLGAINPLHAISFFAANGLRGYFVLGAVVLVITGTEALYADMGHFGLKPIRIGWFTIVFPALLLNYFGQGALMLSDPSVTHPFYEMVPPSMLFPMVALATAATIIASQALISGSFSLTRQAIQLGYLPRLPIIHTSARTEGQIYLPQINTLLMLSCIALVIGFRESTNLAAAYGLAVVGTMAISSVLFFFVATERWHWPVWQAAGLTGFFLFIELALLGANLVKFLHGGWLPLVVGIIVFTTMSTWKKGRALLAEQKRKVSMPIDLFIEDTARHPERRVGGTSVFMTGTAEGVPPALLHNLKHNKIVHERVILLTVVTEEIPHVPKEQRVEVKELGHGFYRVIARYGFMQDPNMSDILAALRPQRLTLPPMETTYYLGRDTLIATHRKTGLSFWRKALFNIMSRNARSATAFFNIPPNRVVELGAQIEI